MTARTRYLLCGASLAPAAVVLGRMAVREEEARARSEGAIATWVDAGPAFYVLLLVGMGCFIAFVVSLVIDLRHGK